MSIDSILSNNIHIYPAANRNPEYLGNVLLEENITRQVKNLLDYPSTILNISVNSNFILTWVNDSTLKVVIPSFSCLISGYNIDIKSLFIAHSLLLFSANNTRRERNEMLICFTLLLLSALKLLR